MNDTISLFGRAIPAYGLLGAAGVLAGLFFVLFRSRRFGLSMDDAAYLFVFAALFGAAGAKMLYLLTVLPELVADIRSGQWTAETLVLRYASGGLVYYGGALGAAAGLFFSARWFKKSVRASFAALVPSLPLMHAIARLGCNLAGCCHGVPTDGPLYRVYTASSYAPNGVRLVPVQLFEAGAEALIFAALLWYTHIKGERAHAFEAYLLLYAPVRFLLEFWRGDAARGFFAGLSTSQWISMLAVLLALFLLRRTKRNFNGI